ncbi:uncharacterized protein IAS62_000287 [Cryptococcus decagattii]|uniref:Vacuolar protein 14 C-terminal Fig4-binding domain-containing protein n=1 Tax=Cryptococcus decagattii TaxID=1859122 RepID=A0ABZ2ANV1_9TREE
MDPAIARNLNDKIYDRRKAAALELEKQVLSSDKLKISAIIDQLCAMLSSSNSALHTRNGGLIGLAATAIALGQDVAPYLGQIIPPVLACFQDPESRLRYHACESLYNIAKVSKGEILVHFNEIFDALSKLSSDSEMSVKNGAELLDRLMKDIVAEAAPSYVSIYPDNRNPSLSLGSAARNRSLTMDSKSHDEYQDVRDVEHFEDNRAFSLERFIPLLSERIYVISPFTRMHLVSWLMVLDSIPDLELVAWLPEFLDGLLKYLSDNNVDVRLATENVLAEFLREIKYIAQVQDKQAESERVAKEAREIVESKKREIGAKDGSAFQDDSESEGGEDREEADEEHNWEGEGSGAWVPGQGVLVDHAAIMEIIIHNLSYDDELVQSTAMEWILTFLEFAQNTVVAFTPQIVPAILPNLASSHSQIKMAAYDTNSSLYHVIQSIALQVQHPRSQTEGPFNAAPLVDPITEVNDSARSPPAAPVSDPLEAATAPPAINSTSAPVSVTAGTAQRGTTSSMLTSGLGHKTRQSATISLHQVSEPVTPSSNDAPAISIVNPAKGTKVQSEYVSTTAPPVQPLPLTSSLLSPKAPVQQMMEEDQDPFDVKETVNVLTLQFLSDHAETRIAALEWLLMLHLKAPDKILSRDSGTFPALLKTLSDPSEDVVKHDLQLLAQISSSSEESYFTSFMIKVLELFSTDRRLLEQRGSLIIRQLCLHLNAERIFRTIAEILEKDDDLEFASMMVVKLNMILITSPELGDFRRRLKNLDSRDGQMLFSSLYRSWCHNAVAAFSLCLLAQAYEHASNLLQIFADLELTVQLLVQIDKLVMLIESPVFTYLRLQLLEPDKYPWLPKCLYGLLMILPQSTAFISLRARLQVVHSSGYVPTNTKTPSTAGFGPTRSKIGKDEIRWQELLSHFRSVQNRHEKARRQLSPTDIGSTQGSIHYPSSFQNYPSNTSVPGPSAVVSSSSTKGEYRHSLGHITRQSEKRGVQFNKRGWFTSPSRKRILSGLRKGASRD